MIPNTEQNNSTRSRGEQVFDWVTYGGLAGVGTFIVTVPISDWITHGGGAKYYNASKSWLTKKGVNPQVAGTLLMTTALMQGGNAMLAPIWGMEQARTPIANTINKLTGDTTPESEIAEKPQQSARSLIEGRLTAFAAVFTGLLGAKLLMGNSTKVIDPSTGKGVSRMSLFENAIGRATAAFMKRPTHVNGVETKTYRYGKTLAVDAFATLTAAGLLFTASRFFAKRGEEKAELKDQQFATAEITAQTPPTTAALTPTSSETKPQATVASIDYDGRTDEQPTLSLSDF